MVYWAISFAMIGTNDTSVFNQYLTQKIMQEADVVIGVMRKSAGASENVVSVLSENNGFLHRLISGNSPNAHFVHMHYPERGSSDYVIV